MLKNRVILVVVAILLIVIIYNLPRIVVDNNPDVDISEQEKAAVVSRGLNESEDISEHHSVEISLVDKRKIDQFKIKFSSSSQEAGLTIADSIAQLYLKYNKFDSAAKYFEYVAVNNPGIRRFETAGDAYFESFSFSMDRERAKSFGDKARYYYREVLKKQPERLDLRNKIAMTYISSSNPMEGINILRQILEEDPENEMAIYNLGTLSVQSGQYEKAEEYFRRLITINPQNMQAQFYLGLSYYELGEKGKAKKQFELVKSMENDPAVVATVEGYLKELN